MSSFLVLLHFLGCCVICAAGETAAATAAATPATVDQVAVDADGSSHIDSGAEWQIIKEDWYRVVMTKSPIGYMLMKTVSNGTFFRSSETMQITVRRGDTDTSTMFVETSVLETMEGETVQMKVSQKVAQQGVSMEYEFGDDVVTVISSSQGSTYNSQLPKPDPSSYVSRLRSQQEFKKRCLAGEKKIVVSVIRPELGVKVVDVTQVKQPRSEGDELVSWKTTITGVPVDVIEGWKPDCSRLVTSAMESPFGPLKCELTGAEEVAQLIAAAAGGKLERSAMPEVVDSASVILPRFYPMVLVARKAHYRVTHQKKGALDLANSGYQRLKRGDPEHRVDVFLDLDRPSPRLPSEDPADFLKASVTIDSKDPLIKRLAKSFILRAGNPKDTFQRADALRRGTRGHIVTKDLATGFASASETARSKTGDCTEHGVLLAALLRASGIPSRVCNGLVYTHASINGKVEAVFGWHMWTQALIEDAWVDLDATLSTSYNVGHLLVGTEVMSDQSVISSAHLKMMTMLNHMDVEVISLS